MKLKRLAVITTHFNPLGKASLRQNYLRALRDMKTWDVDVFSAEVAFGDDAFPTKDAFIQIRASDKHLMWQKERLLNLLVERLPKQYAYIAWVDADVLFLNRNWVNQAQLAMKYFKAAQLFSEVLWLDQDGLVETVIPAIGFNKKQNFEKKNSSSRPKSSNPGMAWIAHRSVFPLYEYCILGGGDSFCASAWCGASEPPQVSKELCEFTFHYNKWAEQAFRKVNKQLAVIRGQIVHLFHGDLGKRRHKQRWEILKKFNYDPQKDVVQDPETGLLKFSSVSNPRFVREVRRYFKLREEP